MNASVGGVGRSDSWDSNSRLLSPVWRVGTVESFPERPQKANHRPMIFVTCGVTHQRNGQPENPPNLGTGVIVPPTGPRFEPRGVGCEMLEGLTSVWRSALSLVQDQPGLCAKAKRTPWAHIRDVRN